MKCSYQINIEPKELSVLNAVVESYIDLCKPDWFGYKRAKKPLFRFSDESREAPSQGLRSHKK